jgi:hypothetical protein
LAISVPGKDREEWFSLRENHGKACRFGLQQLPTAQASWKKTTSVPELTRLLTPEIV